MPGSMWYSFRQGNRSEYLALYILSALGLSIPVLRQEDIGADFYCSLARKEENRMTFYAPFIVQIKSASIKEIRFGGIDDKGRWKKEEIDWLFNQELPLLIGFVDKNDMTLKLYSTSNMWAAYYNSGVEFVLQPDKPADGPDVPAPTNPASPIELAGIENGRSWNIPLGPPLVSISIADTEDEGKMESYRKVLSYPLMIEQQNITYRRLQVHYSAWPHRYETNKPDGVVAGILMVANPVPGANTKAQLEAIKPIIAILAFNYKSQGSLSEIEKLKPIIQLLSNDPSSDPTLNMLRESVPELFQ